MCFTLKPADVRIVIQARNKTGTRQSTRTVREEAASTGARPNFRGMTPNIMEEHTPAGSSVSA